MGKRKTHEQFIEEVRIKNPNIEVLGIYSKSSEKIKCKCLKDGYIWLITPNKILSGRGCPKCAGNIQKTHKEFVKEIKLVNPNIEILGKYVNRESKIKSKCLIHNYIWDVVPASILKGHGCPKCGKNYIRTNEEFINEIKTKNPNILILGKYTYAKTKIQCKCLIDGHIWEVSPDCLLKGQGCPKCKAIATANRMRKTHEDFLKELNRINTNIEILEKYKGSNIKIKCKCLLDGHEWKTTPSCLLSGSGCPSCHSSKGETMVESYCKKKYLQYKIQHKINKCMYKKVLRFDFALFNKNKLIALIEYQGKQHYEVVKHFGGESGFNARKKRDEIKRNYCISNDIPLIEIPYWIDDVEGYLEEQMDKVINKPLQLSLI